MKLSDLIVPGAVIADLKSTDRNAVIRELVESLASAGALAQEDVDTIANAAIQRENQGSTGFGKGVAVPHGKHPKIPKIMAVIGRSAAGVDFTALDRAPVYTIFLLLSPPQSPDAHIQAMENIFRHLQRDNFRKFLRQAETREAILDLLKEADDMSAA